MDAVRAVRGTHNEEACDQFAKIAAGLSDKQVSQHWLGQKKSIPR